MSRFTKFTAFLGGVVLAFGLTSPSAHAITILGPGDADWTSASSSTLSTADVISLTGIAGLTEVYKQNQGDPGPTGSSAGDYTTSFPNGAEDALIEWNGGSFLDCQIMECVLLAKDGSNQPAQQLFNIGSSSLAIPVGGWDGQMDIEMNALWPNMGSFSHVTIYTGPGGGTPGGGQPSGGQVPEPATVLLFGSGLAGLGLWRWSQKKK